MARTKTRPVGRTPTKRRACELWLLQQLAPGPCLAREVLALGVASHWGWATVRRAKVNVGVQSFRKDEEWWWFDPRKFDPQKDSLPPKPAQSRRETPPALTVPKVPEAASPVSLAHTEHNLGPSVVFPPPLPPQLEKPEQQNFSIPPKRIQEATQVPPEKPSTPAAAPRPPQPEIPKPASPPKKRPLHIWDSALTETRDALISAAGFADLYTMRLDIRFRQEHLRARGLLKEETALDELLARVNDALEKKKKAANLE